MKMTQIWGGAAATEGNQVKMSPLRSEHAGALAIIIVLHILHNVTKVDLKAELWVDNAEVIRRVTATDISAEALDYDLHMTTQHWIGVIGYDL